jgi:hypothetical protein
MDEQDQMLKIPIKDLARKVICEGHLYLPFKGGRKVYMLRPGVLLEEDFVKKHATLNTVFDYIPVTNPVVLERFTTLLRELKYLQFEKDLRLKAQEIASYFYQVFTGEEHFLTFALACHREFCTLPEETLSLINGADVLLFRKCLYSAAFSTILAITNDFFHYPMLRDFYNLTFALDVGLCNSNYTYFIAQACNHENQFPGQGRGWLEEKGASAEEKELFFNHPEQGRQYLENLKHLFAYPELAEIVLYQHELSDGSGFPRGVIKGHVSSWEAVVILADAMVEISETYAFESSVISFILDFQNAKLTELPVGKAYRKLCESLRYFEQLKETGT